MKVEQRRIRVVGVLGKIVGDYRMAAIQRREQRAGNKLVGGKYSIRRTSEGRQPACSARTTVVRC